MHKTFVRSSCVIVWSGGVLIRTVFVDFCFDNLSRGLLQRQVNSVNQSMMLQVWSLIG